MVSRFIAKYPVVKTMGAYFCINIAADFNEQVFIKKRTKETYDRGKTARIAATCTFVTSPMMFVWIRFIDRFIPGKTALSVAKKVLADACLFAPTVISTFYITTNILETKEDLTAEWKQKFYPTWSTGLCYWPFVQAVNFAVVPMKYKTCLYMPTASFIWMNYLCFMKDKKVIVLEEEENEDGTQKVMKQTHLKSVPCAADVVLGPDVSTQQPCIHCDNKHSNCVKNIHSQQKLNDGVSVPHRLQEEVCSGSHTTAQCSESPVSPNFWFHLHSDHFTPFIVLSSS